MKKSHGEGDGKSEEFRRFEEAVKHLLTLPKSELQTRLADYKAEGPHKRGPKPKHGGSHENQD